MSDKILQGHVGYAPDYESDRPPSVLRQVDLGRPTVVATTVRLDERKRTAAAVAKWLKKDPEGGFSSGDPRSQITREAALALAEAIERGDWTGHLEET